MPKLEDSALDNEKVIKVKNSIALLAQEFFDEDVQQLTALIKFFGDADKLDEFIATYNMIAKIQNKSTYRTSSESL